MIDLAKLGALSCINTRIFPKESILAFFSLFEHIDLRPCDLFAVSGAAPGNGWD